MKTTSYGRRIFGISAVLFSVIALMWHDSDTWQSLSEPESSAETRQQATTKPSA